MPNGELRIVYDLRSGKTATLAIYSNVAERKMSGAKVKLHIPMVPLRLHKAK